MEELTVLAEIEHTEKLEAVPAAFRPGIWRYCLFAAGAILPDLMDDTFNRVPIKTSNIIIDQIEYAKADNLEELRTILPKDGGWTDGGSVVCVRFEDFLPPHVFSRRRYGVLEGFTNNSPVLLDGLMYRPGLLTAPVTEQGADAFTYDRMKFNGASISLDNSDGRFDKVDHLFGNEFNLRVGTAEDAEDAQPHNLVTLIEDSGSGRVVSMRGGTDEYVAMIGGEEKKRPSLDDYPPLAQYYISNITVTPDKATFHLKDKRERLAGKIPDRRFAKETLGDGFENLDDNLADQDMQEVYGRCFGVPGVCLEGKRIYVDKNNHGLGKLEQYRFRFSSGITRVDRVRVKMTAGDVGDPDGEQGDTIRVDGWTTVYQRVKPDVDSPDFWTGAYPRWKPGISPGNISSALLAKGEISLHWEVAKQGGRRENAVNEVRMDGVFINKTTPLEIIEDVMARYSGVPYVPGKYDMKEITDELDPLTHEIGIMFDRSVSVYEAVEKLQGGCVLGFLFQVYRNRFTARLDNPNRGEGPEIKAAEILNLDEAEIDWNADLYGTYTDVEYAYDYGERAGRHFIDRDTREAILEQHRVEKEWAVHSLLAGEPDAKKKSDILLEDFQAMRPLIKNIKLSGKKWFALRVYDILTVDFSIRGEERAEYPGRFIRLIEDSGSGRVVSLRDKTDEYVTMIGEEKEVSGSREFAGKKVRCQVLRVEFDTRTGITTLDLRVRERSEKWAA